MKKDVNDVAVMPIAPQNGSPTMSRAEKEKIVELRRKALRDGLRRVELPDEVIAGLKGAKVPGRANYQCHTMYPINDQTVVEVDAKEAKIDAEIVDLAGRTPEVRFSKQRMVRDFTDDELKIIAAALRSRTALFRVADSLHCSYTKITRAIENIPILKELADERRFRECEEVEEGIDDCVKSRVPSVLMWKAEKLMPEKYGQQINLDNEDDTKLVIGTIPDEMVEEAERQVLAANAGVPDVKPNAVLTALEQERAAEEAAGGAGVPDSPLSSIPPTPSVKPPDGDPRFSPFVPASEMKRLNEDGPDNYGAVGGGFDDDFDDGSWI